MSLSAVQLCWAASHAPKKTPRTAAQPRRPLSSWLASSTLSGSTITPLWCRHSQLSHFLNLLLAPRPTHEFASFDFAAATRIGSVEILLVAVAVNSFIWPVQTPSSRYQPSSKPHSERVITTLLLYHDLRRTKSHHFLASQTSLPTPEFFCCARPTLSTFPRACCEAHISFCRLLIRTWVRGASPRS